MFRKRNKKAGKNLRRKRNDNDEGHKEGDSDDQDATRIAIQKTTKKHKILESLPLTSVGGNFKKGKNQASSDPTISQTTNAAAASSAELSVLATKHKNNMEAFIKQQMAATDKTSSSSEKTPKLGDKNNSITLEGNLYQQLAREITDVGGNNISSNENRPKNEQQPQHDGDQGDGGAALLGGTGIAEVILPSTNHPPATVPNSNKVWNKNNQLLSSAVPEEERHKHSLPDTTPKPFVKFRKSNNIVLQQNSSRNPGHEDSIHDSHDKAEVSSDTNRKGFDAFRGRTPTSDYTNEGNTATEDSRRKIGKSRDDQVYSHFLKNALNGNNRR